MASLAAFRWWLPTRCESILRFGTLTLDLVDHSCEHSFDNGDRSFQMIWSNGKLILQCQVRTLKLLQNFVAL
ncbi:hypothetical protein BGW36DRAFT_385488 [Talaromyces proteolyticus]|uniref:Uncharacterized protein n=1 Tax=Talaromyces proteolyticus TaxID=1131652 RepID=A0AAD4PXN4_9EURO|nr:uncharacterized protein BGW36DRAFT_385488 [Talaromyces proteolyticus]KAH8692913.1 hypothetical protein BGW36DRAFT_385488 [Talaromyces proteolyticus]